MESIVATSAGFAGGAAAGVAADEAGVGLGVAVWAAVSCANAAANRTLEKVMAINLNLSLLEFIMHSGQFVEAFMADTVQFVG